MLRKFLVGATGAALLFVAVPTTGAEAAAKINGTGHVSCGITGSIKFKPGWSSTTPEVAATSSSKSVLANCSGTGDGAHIVSGKSSSKSSTTTRCPSASDPSTKAVDITNTVKWKTDGAVKLNDTVVHYDTQTSSLDTSTFVVTVTLSGTIVSGSFAGSSTSTVLTLDQTGIDILTGCAAKKGLKAVTYTGVHGDSFTN